MVIKILGPGCPKCQMLKETTERALQETGINAAIVKVEDINKIMEYPIMFTPALVVNEKVKVSGKVPTVEEIKKYLQEETSRGSGLEL